MTPGSYFTVPFDKGKVVVHMNDRGIVTDIEFDLDSLYDARPSDSRIGNRICRYFEGQEVNWGVELDLRGVTRFRRKVYERVARIPYGQTSTYGEIAADVGCPGGARAVGQAMACNRLPLVVPCHRVISGNGKIGGFSSGIALKRFLLGLEGVDI